MPPSIRSVYETLLDEHREVAFKCLDDDVHRDLFTRCHNFLADIEKLIELLDGRPEQSCVVSAGHEFQFALSSSLTGQYRHAFASLRLTFELLVAGVYFSGHELELRQWENSSRDLNWSSLTHSDSGVFAKSFVEAFHPFLSEIAGKYRSLALAAYRECSEFVHGNPARTRQLERKLEFNPKLLEQWSESLENIRITTIYLYLFRYVSSLTTDSMGTLECLACDNLWHEQCVRACFESE